MRLLPFSALTAILVVAACNTKTSQQTRTTTSGGDQALVRFVNADPRTPSADLWFGDRSVAANIAYKNVTPYMPLPDERSTFKLRSAGSTADLATNSEGLSEGRRYTVVAMRSPDGSARLVAVSDTLTAPAPGKAKVRMINSAPRAGEVSLATAGEESDIVDDLNFGNSSDFKEVDATRRTLEIRREGTHVGAVRLNTLQIQPGRLYTIVVTGEQALDAIRIEDELTGTQAASLR